MIVKQALLHAVFRPDGMGKADLVRGEHLFAGLNAFEPGQEHKPHAHCERDKIYFVIEGQGELEVGEETTRVTAGDMALAPAGVVHALRNPGPERLVAMIVMGPPPAQDAPKIVQRENSPHP